MPVIFSSAGIKPAAVAALGISVLLSRALPVFASSGTAANGVSSDYNTPWTTTGATATYAMDISGLSAAQKTVNALYFYGESGVDTTTLYADMAHPTGAGGLLSLMPTAYTVEGNTGAGGGSPPGSGWTTLLTVASNSLASQRCVLSGASALTGYNWVRLNITASSGSTISIKLDLFDESGGSRWILQLGDSRGWFGNTHRKPHGGSVSCDSLGNLMQPVLGYYAPHINMGMSGAQAADIDSLVNGWIAILGVPYAVTMEMGINNATASGWSSAYTTSMQSIVTKCLNAGARKFFLETIGDSTNSTVHSNINSGYLTAIAGIISGTTNCFAGFDTYTFLNNTPSYLSGDQIHETDTGFVALTTAKGAPFYATKL